MLAYCACGMRIRGARGEGLFLRNPFCQQWGQEQALWRKEGGSRTQKPEALSRTMAAARGGMGVVNGPRKGLMGEEESLRGGFHSLRLQGNPVKAVPYPAVF